MDGVDPTKFRGKSTPLMLAVCLSVCLSRSCIVLRLQKISTRFLHSHAYDSPLSLPGRVQLKFCSHGPTPSSPNFAPK